MGDRKNKYKLIFFLIMLIEMLIASFYMGILKINPNVFYYALKTFVLGTMDYNTAQLGTLVLTSSLIGLSLIIANSIILLESKIKLNIKGFIEWIWMIPAISFIYAMFFSVTKLLLGFVIEVETIQKVSLGHIAFSFLIIGLVSFVFWFTILTLKINSMSQNNETQRGNKK